MEKSVIFYVSLICTLLELFRERIKNITNVNNVSTSAMIIEISVPILAKLGINKKEDITAVLKLIMTDISNFPSSCRLINH